MLYMLISYIVIELYTNPFYQVEVVFVLGGTIFFLQLLFTVSPITIIVVPSHPQPPFLSCLFI